MNTNWEKYIELLTILPQDSSNKVRLAVAENTGTPSNLLRIRLVSTE